MCLDIGQVFEKSTFKPRERVTRLIEMREYLKADIGAQIEQLRTQEASVTTRQFHIILQSALTNTFSIYEGAL